MSNTRKLILVAALSGLVSAVSFGAHANNSVGGDETYPEFTSEVGTTVYSPGPLIPMHEFKLKMHMMHPAMNVIKQDYQAGKKLTCTMVPAGTNNDMAILDCTPAG